MKYHKKGYPLIRRNVGDLWHWGQHMAYLSLTGNDARAVKLLETHLPDVEASHDPLGSLAFFRTMLIVVEGLMDKKEKMTLRVPPESPFANQSGEYVLSDFAKSRAVSTVGTAIRTTRSWSNRRPSYTGRRHECRTTADRACSWLR
jgi:hypothetical protein